MMMAQHQTRRQRQPQHDQEHRPARLHHQMPERDMRPPWATVSTTTGSILSFHQPHEAFPASREHPAPSQFRRERPETCQICRNCGGSGHVHPNPPRSRTVTGQLMPHMKQSWLRLCYDCDSGRDFSCAASSCGNRFGRPRPSISATVTSALNRILPPSTTCWSSSSRAPPFARNRVSTSSRSSSRAGAGNRTPCGGRQNPCPRTCC